MKHYPIEHECRKRIDFWPEKPAVFDGDVLEIGPGRGDLLMHMAEAHPDKKFVGIEIGRRRFFKLIPRILKRNLKNIQLIGGNARVVLPLYYRSNIFEQAYVLFPDPWPKKRHIPHRLLSVQFMTLVARSLKVGGDFFVATDVAGYAGWVLENAEQIDFLELVRPPTMNEPLIEGYIPTFFEAKWREMGRNIHYQHYRKTREITEPLDDEARMVIEILGHGG
jgi:tRNA (guanine-N7-)-methyltransferase